MKNEELALPLFSYEVVIPAWNAEPYIGETLASIAAQTIPPARVTVVDDGSTDRTVAIARASGATVLAGAHAGVVSARNRGLAAVEESFVAFVDSDDTWLPEYAESQAEAWRSAPSDLAAVGTRVEPFGDGDLTAWRGPTPSGGYRVLATREVWDRNPLTASTIMFRTEALRRISGWREGYTPTDDYDATLRLVSSGFVVGMLDTVLGGYRVRNGSWSSHAAASLQSEQKALLDFWCSDFRRRCEPDLSYESRLRLLWWRTLARAAQYGQDLTFVPAPPADFHPTLAMRLTHAAVQLPSASRLAASSWRHMRRRIRRK